MSYPEYNPDELKVVGEIPSPMGGPCMPVLNYPVDPGEACRLMYQRKAPWQINGLFNSGSAMLNPAVIPDNVARAMAIDATVDPSVVPVGGKDMFGIEWEYVPAVGGSMVRPGKPFVEDANDLEDMVVWPDIESWDWEGNRKANEDYIAMNKGKCFNTTILNGYFERLISMMDFDNAIVALIDEEQKEAVHAFLDKLSDLYVKLIDKMVEVYPEIEVYQIHDDWGSQRASFFSPETGAEMLVPYMKKVTDRVHFHGKYAHCHSCGHMMNQVENLIAAGYDAWDPQPMNDTQELYEKYGDRILIGLIPRMDIKNTTEEEQRAYAKEFVSKYCRPEKQSMMGMYASPIVAAMLGGENFVTPAFEEEVYILSRKSYMNND
ncbi:MAG: uroporphyrinogen decarboxylase family protein [Coprococcus sp.]